MGSLLQIAEPVATRLKCLVMGNAGTGKTITALSFPNPAVVNGHLMG
jgi:transcriptional regulator with AAA-type ATPase domain